jgi:hypothetical protein
VISLGVLIAYTRATFKLLSATREQAATALAQLHAATSPVVILAVNGGMLVARNVGSGPALDTWIKPWDNSHVTLSLLHATAVIQHEPGEQVKTVADMLATEKTSIPDACKDLPPPTVYRSYVTAEPPPVERFAVETTDTACIAAELKQYFPETTRRDVGRPMCIMYKGTDSEWYETWHTVSFIDGTSGMSGIVLRLDHWEHVGPDINKPCTVLPKDKPKQSR